MKVEYYPNDLAPVHGSHLQGHQDASYDQLVKLFVEPNDAARYVESYDWHIGGYSKEAAHLVSDLIIDDRFGNNSSFYGKFRRVRS